MASIRTVSSTFEIDPRMMHASGYINRRMIGGCCDSALFKVETSAPLGDSLIHTQTWQFIMTCWDGFGSDLLGKFESSKTMSFLYILPGLRPFCDSTKVFSPSWKGYFHWISVVTRSSRPGAGLGFFGDGRGAGTAPHTPEKGFLGTSLLEESHRIFFWVFFFGWAIPCEK